MGISAEGAGFCGAESSRAVLFVAYEDASLEKFPF